MRMSRSEWLFLWLFLQGRGPKPERRPKPSPETWPATRFQEECIAASQFNDRLRHQLGRPLTYRDIAKDLADRRNREKQAA